MLYFCFCHFLLQFSNLFLASFLSNFFSPCLFILCNKHQTFAFYILAHQSLTKMEALKLHDKIILFELQSCTNDFALLFCTKWYEFSHWQGNPLLHQPVARSYFKCFSCQQQQLSAIIERISMSKLRENYIQRSENK